VQPALTFLSEPSPCEYLRDQTSQLEYAVYQRFRAADYMDRMREGWRRFGPLTFRPACPTCRRCQSLRVPVATFEPNESQRRAWKMNFAEIAIRVGTPSSSDEKLDLFARFHRYRHEERGWSHDEDHSLDLFLTNPFPTEEWSYHLGERLIAVGYVDALPEGLSAIYFYWDPAQRHRSLGTFNVLALIDAARRRGVPHVYLGYYVEGCASLSYKARFRPNEVIGPAGWEPFVGARR
jgi:leucyl-tRNA---protein transferase